jgi:hypothetical protein
MKHFLLEGTIPLLGVVVVTVIALGIVWSQRQTPGMRRAFVASIVVGLLLLLVNRLVETDREAIERMVRQLAVAVESNDMASVAAHLDDAYAAEGFSKDEIVPLIEITLKRVDVSQARLSRFEFDVNGDQASIEFDAFCRLRSNNFEQPVLSRWALDVARVDDGWRVTAIQPLVFNKQKVDGLSDLLGRGAR